MIFMNKKAGSEGSTTDLPLIEISQSLQRYAVLPNPESTSAIEEEVSIQETPLAVFREQEFEEKEFIEWKK